MALSLSIAIISCTGPEGPAGKDGATGTAVCKVCHSDNTFMYAKMMQYDNSQHALGVNFQRNTNTCAPCHTSEGYRETAVTGADTTVATIQNPTTINCRTCHFIHTNFDTTDFNLTFTKTVNLRIGGQMTHDIGKGNLCAKCHQGRPTSPMPVLGGDSVSITSSHWGPHHSPVANMLNGNGAFEYTQGSYASPHLNVPDGCVTCHMATAIGNQAGGHTWRMSTGTTDNVAGCLTCHSGVKSFDINGTQSDVEASLVQLRNTLSTKGWIDTTSSGGEYNMDVVVATSSKPLKLSANQAGALYNYMMIAADRSMGVHNPNYIKTLLTGSINAVSQ